jgi:hypothetical protein
VGHGHVLASVAPSARPAPVVLRIDGDRDRRAGVRASGRAPENGHLLYNFSFAN